MKKQVWWLFPLLGLSLVASCATGSAMPAPDPIDDESGVAPEPPARKAESLLVTWKGRPGDNVTWFDYKASKSLSDPSWGTVLTDIENHIPPKYGTTYRDSDKLTWAHETSHGIHSDIRNYYNKTGKRANGLYALDNKGVVIVEPNIRKSAAAKHIPSSLRGSRYSLYITGQVEWDDTPLYIWDEWNAYVNGGACGVDLVEKGKFTGGWRDGVNGQLEFAVYAVAVAMAVQEGDPSYFTSNEQFREFLAWNLRRTMDIYRKGAVMKEFKWDKQDAYYEAMKTGADAATWRGFVRDFFGEQFWKEVFLGDPTGPVDPPDAGPLPDSGPPDSGPVVPPDSGPPDTGPPPSGDVDTDRDGIPDVADLCSGTPAGANVWTFGEWLGCAGGQRRDSGPWGGTDTDGDGISDAKDLCTKTPAGKKVWTNGEWTGCAAGEFRDK
jgi:hypothetical protein